MDTHALIRRLGHTASTVKALTADVQDGQARWKPAPDRWSILEVVCHMADEESRDFRTRLDLTLHRPGESWPPIDPESWVTEHDYASRVLAEEVRRFRDERTRSKAWLESLDAPQWSHTYEHPKMGTLSAADLLASWVAHDLIHIRQITRLHRRYLEAVMAPGTRVEYAGRW